MRQDHGMIAQLHAFQALVVLGPEGVAHELGNGGEHARDGIGVAVGHRLGGQVLHQQSAVRLDQEHLFDTVHQGMSQHHLAEGDAAAHGLQPPLEPLDRQAVLERAVDVLEQATQGVGDRLTDRRPHHRVEGIGESLGVLLDGRFDATGDRCGQGFGEFEALLVALAEGVGKDIGHVLGAQCRVFQTLGQVLDLGLFLVEQQRLEGLQRLITRGRRDGSPARGGAPAHAFQVSRVSASCRISPASCLRLTLAASNWSSC